MVDIISLDDDVDGVATSLQPYFQSGNINFIIGSGGSMPAVQVAGDIETEINELLLDGSDADANIRSLDFIESIEDICDELGSLEFADDDIKNTFSNYKTFLSNVDRILFERKSTLLPRQANVFTTNYDTFIEAAAAELPSLILNDGFDRTSALNGAFAFAPELYFDRTYRSGAVYNRQAEVPTVNLLKIHGSLSWRKSAKQVLYRRSRIKKLTDVERAVEATVAAALEKRALILPNVRKFQSTLLDRVYYDLLRMFANALDKENALLVAFGFSFADEHLLDITKRALRNPTAQLLVVAYDMTAKAHFEGIFAQQRNVKIIYPGEDGTIDFVRFNALLDSIPPAMKST